MLFVHEPPSSEKFGCSRLISARALSAAPGSHLLMRANTWPWWIGRHAGSIRSFTPACSISSRYSVTLTVDDALGAEAADRLPVAAGEFVHHDAAVLAVADLRHQRRDPDAAHLLPLQALGLVKRLHLGDQLGVRALRLDDGDDRHLLAGGVAGDQPVRHVLVARGRGPPAFRPCAPAPAATGSRTP